MIQWNGFMSISIETLSKITNRTFKSVDVISHTVKVIWLHSLFSVSLYPHLSLSLTLSVIYLLLSLTPSYSLPPLSASPSFSLPSLSILCPSLFFVSLLISIHSLSLTDSLHLSQIGLSSFSVCFTFYPPSHSSTLSLHLLFVSFSLGVFPSLSHCKAL